MNDYKSKAQEDKRMLDEQLDRLFTCDNQEEFTKHTDWAVKWFDSYVMNAHSYHVNRKE